MERWSLWDLVAVLDAQLSCYLSCREFWTLGEGCKSLWQVTRHPSSDEHDLHERTSIISHLVWCEITFAVRLPAGDVCRNLPWYATFPTSMRILSMAYKVPGEAWQWLVPDPWWLHVASLVMDTGPWAWRAEGSGQGSTGCKYDLASLLRLTVSKCPSSLVPAGYLDNLCALGSVWVTFSVTRDKLCRHLSFLSPDFPRLHALHQCEMPAEEIIEICTRGYVVSRGDNIGVLGMWNWLHKSGFDSFHQRFLSRFFSNPNPADIDVWQMVQMVRSLNRRSISLALSEGAHGLDLL